MSKFTKATVSTVTRFRASTARFYARGRKQGEAMHRHMVEVYLDGQKEPVNMVARPTVFEEFKLVPGARVLVETTDTGSVIIGLIEEGI